MLVFALVGFSWVLKERLNLGEGGLCWNIGRVVIFSCLLWWYHGEERDLAEEKGEEKWEVENKKAWTFRKDVVIWS